MNSTPLLSDQDERSDYMQKSNQDPLSPPPKKKKPGRPSNPNKKNGPGRPPSKTQSQIEEKRAQREEQML